MTTAVSERELSSQMFALNVHGEKGIQALAELVLAYEFQPEHELHVPLVIKLDDGRVVTGCNSIGTCEVHLVPEEGHAARMVKVTPFVVGLIEDGTPFAVSNHGRGAVDFLPVLWQIHELALPIFSELPDA